jgi:glycogen debranching enzyme
MTVEDAFRIRATSNAAFDRSRVLKDGEIFAIFDRFGDVQSVDVGPQGIYLGGTRHLSRLALLVEGAPPLLLTSVVRNSDCSLVVDLTNPDTSGRLTDSLAADTLLIRRHKVLLDCTCFESITVRSHAQQEIEVNLSLLFACDYADVFEVRGTDRKARGTHWTPRVDRDTVGFSYLGLDQKRRGTQLRFEPAPDTLGESEARFRLQIKPGETVNIAVTVRCESPDVHEETALVTSYQEASDEAARRRRATREGTCVINSSNELFNMWVERSFADLYLLTTFTEHGPYPYAGIPWFSSPFGRDGLLTAFQCLWLEPQLTRGVIEYLAAHQAATVDPERDAAPGKILHERRLGEMANLREIPFGHYYGSIDSTPLFVHLVGEYFERTADLELLRRTFPAVERALSWIFEQGQAPNGYLAYARMSRHGLVNQGWKDSRDSIFHENGGEAAAPIALCEVQGYAFAALRSGAKMARQLGRTELSQECEQRAATMAESFDRDFWCPELSTFALALDGEGRQCRVRSSNAGQCLWSGIVPPKRAPALARTLMSPASFSGWGVRTIAEGEPRYNPLAYHNGSVWPHDTSLVAAGLSRYGEKDAALTIMSGLFDAARKFDLFRLPEVFCGLPRTRGGSPTPYPVACAPQAWASGAVFLLLQAALGITVDSHRNVIEFDRPQLPPEIDQLEVRRLRAGSSSVDFVLSRHERDVGLEILRRDGDVRIIISK